MCSIASDQNKSAIQGIQSYSCVPVCPSLNTHWKQKSLDHNYKCILLYIGIETPKEQPTVSKATIGYYPPTIATVLGVLVGLMIMW